MPEPRESLDTHPAAAERARLVSLARGVVLGAGVGLVCGAASALFLWLLDRATSLRTANELLVFALPLAGLALGWVYERYGATILPGNNLVIDAIHDGGPELPARMAPMVLVGTVLTHLFGGSAGREGTAVQMGASLTDWLSHRLRLAPALRRQLLAAGAAGGFGSVFGTPIAGAIFGLEFAPADPEDAAGRPGARVPGRLRYAALVPALVASVTGDLATRGLGVGHTLYPAAPAVPLDALLLLKWHAFAAAIALAAVAFIELTHALKRWGQARLPRLPLRMLAGGAAVVALWQLAGTSDYLGLGVPTIVRAFTDPALPPEAFAWKLVFTAVTIGAGFLGGEVTPLFFVGATLGNALARALDLPIALGAGVGLAALFAAASNTPLALSVMAVELLGGAALPHVAIVCVLAYALSGRRSIYAAQLAPTRARRSSPDRPAESSGSAGTNSPDRPAESSGSAGTNSPDRPAESSGSAGTNSPDRPAESSGSAGTNSPDRPAESSGSAGTNLPEHECRGRHSNSPEHECRGRHSN